METGHKQIKKGVFPQILGTPWTLAPEEWKCPSYPLLFLEKLISKDDKPIPALQCA